MTVTTMRAFVEGTMMGMATIQSDSSGKITFILMAYMKMLIRNKEQELSTKADQAMKGSGLK